VVASGQALFEQNGCVTCHQPGSVLGPQLAGLVGSTVTLQDGSTVQATDDYIRESILTPTAKVVKGFAPVMPTFKGQLNEEQILQLIAYIKSLGPAAAGGEGAGAGQGKTGT
jgi:cytochrome c oxidase subunit 2